MRPLSCGAYVNVTENRAQKPGHYITFSNCSSNYSDEDVTDQKLRGDNGTQAMANGAGSFLDTPQNAAAIEYKKGYVMRKCCYDSNNKKSEFFVRLRYRSPSIIATCLCVCVSWLTAKIIMRGTRST